MMKKEEIQKTIEAAKNGSQLAYKHLLNLYWGDVYRFLLAKCHNDYEAEDITIKTFSKAFDKLALYNKKYAFKNWLLTISNNLFIDFVRSQNKNIDAVDIDKEKVIKVIDLAPSPEDKLIQEQHLAELLQYIKQLKPHYREVINLRYFQEYSYKEIAEELGESLNNVKVKLLRARKLLSELINNK
jgi:RNA polymerase sigma-70 factor (ECF subfamily)